MSRKVKIILNPMADMGNAYKVANDLRPIVAEYGNADWSGTVYPTHATELAKQAGEEGYDMVIAMGGDGTVHEVVNGLMQVSKDKRPILGVVPVGSGNDFAFACGMPLHSGQALTHALEGEPSSVDVGLMIDENGRKEYFDNSIGIGFDAVVTIRSHKLPLLRGFLMYLTAVIQTIIINHDPSKMNLIIDGENLESTNIMTTICNGPREGGGFMIAPEAINTDGILHYTLVTNCSRPMMFRLIPEFMNGTHERFEMVKIGTGRKFSLTSELPLYIHADGEIYTSFGSNIKHVNFEVLPNELRVITG